MRILVFLPSFIFFFLQFFSVNGAATESVSCSESKLSENALTDKMNKLKDNLQSKSLSPTERKQMVKKTLDEMNCQIDLTAKDTNIDSPSRWKSIQYQDLLTTALKSDCNASQQSIAIKSEGAGHADLPESATKNEQDFLNAYCIKKSGK